MNVLRGLTLKKKIWITIAIVLIAGFAYLFPKWKAASNNGGQLPLKPFRIAGNLYYVGTRDVTSYLIAGPNGHVLIDGGYPGTAKMIRKSIAALGFKITDVKILLNSHGHFDHAGGLAELQKASGAKLWVSQGEADMLSSGGASHRNPSLFNMLVYIGLLKYPPARVDHTFKDSVQINVGPIHLTGLVTGGHTPGATTWIIPLQEGKRKLLAVDMGDLQEPIPSSIFNWKLSAEVKQEFEKGFKTLRSLPVDIYLANHARAFSLKRKLSECTKQDSITPFIDRQGYLDDIAKAEQRYRKKVADENEK